MEYHIPTAADMPPIELWIREEDRSPTNPLGVKGAGEDGIVAAGAAVANAVADALAPLGVEITALPLRADRLRELIRAAVASAPWGVPRPSLACGIGSLGRPTSESGRLRHGDGAHGRGDRAARGP
jgi:hypothetical protein